MLLDKNIPLWIKIVFILLIVVLIYLIFIPNFLCKRTTETYDPLKDPITLAALEKRDIQIALYKDYINDLHLTRDSLKAANKIKDKEIEQLEKQKTTVIIKHKEIRAKIRTLSEIELEEWINQKLLE